MKEALYLAEGCRESVIRQAVEKHLSVSLPGNPIIEYCEHAAVGAAADESSEALLQCERGLRNQERRLARPTWKRGDGEQSKPAGSLSQIGQSGLAAIESCIPDRTSRWTFRWPKLPALWGQKLARPVTA